MKKFVKYVFISLIATVFIMMLINKSFFVFKTVITHRIVKIDKDTIITQGDANNTEDEPITEKNIIGKVIYRFKLMGYLLYLFSQPKYLIIIFVLGLLITIFIPDKKKIKKGV